MKYFQSDQETIWSTKVNFVDDNNVLIGYDFCGQCSEEFGWYISDRVTDSKEGCVFSDNIDVNAINESLKDWSFDTGFFQELNGNNANDFNDDKRVAFRLVNEDNELFLHLYNIHNGYYGHGFDFAKDGEVIKIGYL